MIVSFPFIGKVKHSQAVVTFLQRVAWIVPKDGQLTISYRKIWSVTLHILPETPVNSCTPSAMPQNHASSSARPAVTAGDLTMGHQGSNLSASHFLYSSAGRKSKHERKHTPVRVLVTATVPGRLPAASFQMLLSALDLCLAGIKDVHLTMQLGFCWV